MIRLECSVRQIFPQIEQTNFILQIDSTECVLIFKGSVYSSITVG